MNIMMKNLACGYKDKIIVEHINLQINTGEITCILGPNGVGKTTFFKTILGFLKPISGEIYIDGKALETWKREDFAKVIAYVPQVQKQAFPYQVLEVVCMGRTAHLSKFSSPSKKDYQYCEQVLERLNISYLSNQIFTQISGGEQQLVLIARALAQNPRMLLMDEPASNLDYGNQIRLLQQMKRLLKTEIGIVMITHSPEHVIRCADKVILFTPDKKIKFGTTTEVIDESILKRIYGIDVKIIESINEDGSIDKTCMAVLKDD